MEAAMRATRSVLLAIGLAACGNGDRVVDPACRLQVEPTACTQCCLDQGYTGAVELNDEVCGCRRADVGDDGGDADLRT